MNHIIAGIYGTHGTEKVAHEGGASISTLSDLAEALIMEEMPEGAPLEKVASVHEGVLSDLAFYDLSGRAAAQSEFSSMEKMASEGDTSALEAFFEEQVEYEDGPHAEAAAIKMAALAELQRRAGL